MPLTIDASGLTLALVGVPAVSGAVAYALKVYTDHKVKAGFVAEEQRRKSTYDVELERLKADLAREADLIRHEHSRRLQDSSVFATKRDDVYSSLFALFADVVEASHDAARSLENTWTDEVLEEDQATSYAVGQGVPSEKINRLLDVMADVPNGVRAEKLYELAVVHAKERRSELRQRLEEHHSRHALYVSDEVEALCRQLDYRIACCTTRGHLAAVYEAEDALNAVKSRMRAELSGAVPSATLPTAFTAPLEDSAPATAGTALVAPARAPRSRSGVRV